VAGWIVIGIVVLLPVWMIFIYNRLVSLRNEVESAWHQIDVQLKRRHDLIPNLVAAVKGYMDFERATLENVTSARAGAMAAVTVHEKAVREEALTRALAGLLMTVENYPALKSSENVLDLQEELTTTENRIAFARQFYNDLVAEFMTKREVFPDTMVASLFSFGAAEYFSADAEDRLVPSARAAGPG
jgi:LemA protein